MWRTQNFLTTAFRKSWHASVRVKYAIELARTVRLGHALDAVISWTVPSLTRPRHRLCAVATKPLPAATPRASMYSKEDL